MGAHGEGAVRVAVLVVLVMFKDMDWGSEGGMSGCIAQGRAADDEPYRSEVRRKMK